MNGRQALLVAALVSATALAGCAGNDAPGETVQKGGAASDPRPTSGTTTSAPPPTPTERPRGTSERWHFHDYWQGNPNLTLFQGPITLSPRVGDDGVPAVGAIVELPHGVIVPPETGLLTFNVTWPEPPAGAVNITYKPADSNDYFIAGDAANGVPLVIATTESNCDVPHRQASAWRFNLSAAPAGTPPQVPPRELELTITATIGRPLFIDPPHLNWWREGETISVVAGAAGEIRAAQTPATNLTLPGLPPNPEDPPSPGQLNQSHRIPVDEARIVPEGTKTVVVMLNWTTQQPQGKLAVRFAENNYPSEGPMELISEDGTNRIYAIKIAAAQTDTTYSNRTTWEFRIVPEGGAVTAFEGSYTLVAWASRLEPAAAVAAVTASAPAEG